MRIHSVALLGWLLSLSAPCFAQQYQLIELPLPAPFTQSRTSDINDAGDVIGDVRGEDNIYRAALWTNGQFILITDGMGSGTGSVPNKINRQGQAIGTFDTHIVESVRYNHAFLYDYGGQDLGTPGTSSLGIGINNVGEAVGALDIMSADNGDHPDYRACVWKDGQVSLLAGVSDVPSTAWDINDNHQIVGEADQQAFIWEAGQWEPIAFREDQTSSARAINNLGQVVGYGFRPGFFDAHAFLWEKAIGIQDIGELYDNRFSLALAINNHSQVVGWGDIRFGPQHAFLWQQGQMLDLNSLIPTDTGVTLIRAGGINDKGQIVAVGVKDKLERAYLLNPRSAQEPLIGDINNDTQVNVVDAILSLQFAVGLLSPASNEQRSAADANKDSNLNVQDAVMILRKAVGLP
jgi:probable HAF family extracellular repeat protein